MKTRRDLTMIEAELSAAKEALQHVKGKPTEVYARIVGYYRSVRNWNKGKREEYDQRTLFSPSLETSSHTIINSSQASNFTDIVHQELDNKQNVHYYELFVRTTCPKCPPVKACVAHMDMEGTLVDVDSEQGFEKARSMGIFSAPTVIFYTESGEEVFRAHTVEEIQELPLPVSVHN